MLLLQIFEALSALKSENDSSAALRQTMFRNWANQGRCTTIRYPRYAMWNDADARSWLSGLTWTGRPESLAATKETGDERSMDIAAQLGPNDNRGSEASSLARWPQSRVLYSSSTGRSRTGRVGSRPAASIRHYSVVANCLTHSWLNVRGIAAAFSLSWLPQDQQEPATVELMAAATAQRATSRRGCKSFDRKSRQLCPKIGLCAVACRRRGCFAGR